MKQIFFSIDVNIGFADEWDFADADGVVGKVSIVSQSEGSLENQTNYVLRVTFAEPFANDHYLIARETTVPEISMLRNGEVTVVTKRAHDIDLAMSFVAGEGHETDGGRTTFLLSGV